MSKRLTKREMIEQIKKANPSLKVFQKSKLADVKEIYKMISTKEQIAPKVDEVDEVDELIDELIDVPEQVDPCLSDLEEDELSSNPIDEYIEEKPVPKPKPGRRVIKSNKIEKQPVQDRGMTLAEAKKEVKTLLSEFSKKNELYLKNYQLKARNLTLTDIDVDKLVEYWDLAESMVTDESNVIIDSIDIRVNIPESFYLMIENGISRQKSRFEKLLNEL